MSTNELQPVVSVHTRENIKAREGAIRQGMNTPVKYQIYYYNGLTCQQKRGPNTESRVRTTYIGPKKEIQLKIRCSQVDVKQPQIWFPGLGYNPPQALVAAAGGFVGIEDYAKGRLEKFVNQQFKEIISQAPSVRKIVVIGHSLGGRVVNMLIDRIKNYRPKGLELKKNEWVKNWRKKFIFLTLGSVEKKGGRSIPQDMEFWQVMNVDDLVLNGLFNVSTRRLNQIRSIMEGTRANVSQNRNMFNTANIKWKPWSTLRKRYVDPGERIIWIKTSSTNPDKIHSDYDKRDGLIDSVVAYFGSRIAANNKANSNRLTAAQKAVRQMPRGSARPALTRANKRNVRSMRKAASETALKKISGRWLTKARAKLAAKKQGVSLNGRQTGENAAPNGLRGVAHMARVGAAAGRAGISAVQQELPGYQALANAWRKAGFGNIGNVTIRNMVRTAGGTKALVGEIGRVKEAMDRGFAGEMSLLATLFSGKMADAAKNAMKSAAGKQIGKIFIRYATGKIDWSMAMVLLDARDISQLNLRKASKNLFTPNELYNWAMADPNRTRYYSTNEKNLGHIIPNFTAGNVHISVEKKREITNYVINKISSEGGLHWLGSRFTPFAAKFGMGVAQELYIAIGLKKGMEMAKSKAKPLVGPLGDVVSAFYISGGSTTAAAAVMAAIIVGHMTEYGRRNLMAKIESKGAPEALRNLARNRGNTHLGRALLVAASGIEKSKAAGGKVANVARSVGAAAGRVRNVARQKAGSAARATGRGVGKLLNVMGRPLEGLFAEEERQANQRQRQTARRARQTENWMREQKERRRQNARQANARQTAMRATSALLRQARLRQAGVTESDVALLQRAGSAAPTLRRAQSARRNAAGPSPRRAASLRRASSMRAGGAGMSPRAPGPRTEAQAAILRELEAAQPVLRNRTREGVFKLARRRAGAAVQTAAGAARALGRTVRPGWWVADARAVREAEMQRARRPSKLKNMKSRVTNASKQAVLSKV